MTFRGGDVALRAIGATLAAVSIAFAGYMLTHGDGKVRVLGMEYLAIFARPRGPAIIASQPPPAGVTAVDMAATGSVAEPLARPRPPPRPEIVAACSHRGWVRMDGKIVAIAPGEDVPGLGRIGAILRRGGGWAVLDDQGVTLLTLPGPANGAALFSRRLIFD
jgi:hypothetical protein